MAIFFDCPFCTYGKNVPDSYRGKKIKCPRCLATLTLGLPQPTALTALALPDDDESPVDQAAIEVDKSSVRVECPFCFELIEIEDEQCPYCNRYVDQDASGTDQLPTHGGMLQDYEMNISKIQKIFYYSIASLICGLGIIFGPLSIILGLKMKKLPAEIIGQKGIETLNTAILMGVAGSFGSLVLIVSIIMRFTS